VVGNFVFFPRKTVIRFSDARYEGREQFFFPKDNQNRYFSLRPILVSYAEEVRQMKKDPVCGMMVDEKTARHTSSHEGKNYYFCSEICKKTFDKAPSRYAIESNR